MHILVTGATGYVGTRLIPELLERGHRVRCLARRAERLRLRPWFERVEVMEGDALVPGSLPAALEGIEAAYYLIHNMSSGPRYREHELAAAQNFGRAARAAHLRHIVYLGGLGQGRAGRHMSSRRAAGEALRAGGVPVTELRASVIIGSGSISFEMIRCITDWCPLVLAPVPVDVPGQPIATRDLLAYLLAALDNPAALGRILEIGGDALAYPDLLMIYARLRGLPRGRLPIPFFNATIFAAVADKLTPVPFAIARPLMEELVAASVVTDQAARQVFAAIQPMAYAEAVALALARAELPDDSPWMESLITRVPLMGAHVRTLGEGLLIEYRERNANWHFALRLLNGDPAPGWMIAAKKDGAWIRLRNARDIPGVLYREIQLKSGTLRDALLFEPRGLTGLLWWHFGLWRWHVRDS